jgi:hypothetical protein
MRSFVMEHPEYKHDSVVGEHIAYDLLKSCHEISNNGQPCPRLFGCPETLTTRSIGPEFESRHGANGKATTNGAVTNGI